MKSSTSNLEFEFELINSLEQKILSEFSKNIFDNAFYLNRSVMLLDNNFEEFSFNKNKWDKNPKQFCLEKYGSHLFDKLLLLVNNISTTFEFHNDNIKIIKAPKLYIIDRIASFK